MVLVPRNTIGQSSTAEHNRQVFFFTINGKKMFSQIKNKGTFFLGTFAFFFHCSLHIYKFLQTQICDNVKINVVTVQCKHLKVIQSSTCAVVHTDVQSSTVKQYAVGQICTVQQYKLRCIDLQRVMYKVLQKCTQLYTAFYSFTKLKIFANSCKGCGQPYRSCCTQLQSKQL